MRYGAPHTPAPPPARPTFDPHNPPTLVFDGTTIWRRNNTTDRGIETCYTSTGDDRALLHELTLRGRPVVERPDTDTTTITTHLRHLATTEPDLLAGTLYATAAWTTGPVIARNSRYRLLDLAAGVPLVDLPDQADTDTVDQILPILTRWTTDTTQYIDPMPNLAELFAGVVHGTPLANWARISTPELRKLPGSSEIANWLFSYLGV